MDETKDLVKKITEGIQEKKGRNIVIADLTNIEWYQIQKAAGSRTQKIDTIKL